MISVFLTLIVFVFTGCGNGNKSEPVPTVDLHSAVYTENLDAIRQHIKAGSDLNVLEPTRASTPLITAAYLGKDEVAEILLDAGADLNYQNADGSTALHTSTVFGNTEFAKTLIDRGAQLNIQNNEGSTALHTAVFFGRIELVEALLDKGADKTLKNKMGSTALEVAEVPFENIKGLYDAVGTAFKPLGLRLDYDHIKSVRPKIAQMLK
jgi:ankyrin repeat protein